MTIKQRINAFSELGETIKNLSDDKLKELCAQARAENPWFTEENVKTALEGIVILLDTKRHHEWIKRYEIKSQQKVVGIVMAGNIPLVGFHDFLCVLMSGNIAKAKLSSRDTSLMRFICLKLVEIDNDFESQIILSEQLKDIDAVIATGSDNSSRYFDHYFSKYPNIIRKNRTSCAIIHKEDMPSDLSRLGKDIFTYFGLGCRNVSKLYVPKGYKFDTFYEAMEDYSQVINHHKYSNNYDYNKSIYLVNGEQHLDNGFLLLKKESALVSPIAVVFYEEYHNMDDLSAKLKPLHEKIQCVVSNSSWYPGSYNFGEAQYPTISDYADNVDTMNFLTTL